MALVQISPFCYSQYEEQAAVFSWWLVDYIHNNSVHGSKGWVQQFQSYSYSRKKNHSNEVLWLLGVQRRFKFHDDLLCNLNSNDGLLSVINIIMDWGGMKHYQLGHISPIRASLHELENETSNSPWLVEVSELDSEDRIAPVSKIYCMFEPQKWVIYDSRVATALACLVRRFWADVGTEIITQDFLRFPIPPRNKRGWTRPDGFPGASKGTQGSLGFIYASWIARNVSTILRANTKYGVPPTLTTMSHPYLSNNWSVYHIEMVLWMLGDKEF